MLLNRGQSDRFRISLDFRELLSYWSLEEFMTIVKRSWPNTRGAFLARSVRSKISQSISMLVCFKIQRVVVRLAVAPLARIFGLVAVDGVSSAGRRQGEASSCEQGRWCKRNKHRKYFSGH